MKTNEFKKDLEIDPEQLDVQAGMQGELFFKWAEKAAAARKFMERSKFYLDVLEAKLSNQARADPDAFGIRKVTEAAIVTAVRISDEYTEAYEDYLQARADSALLDKAVEALEQKKRMIEVMITLHGQQYFAGPAVPRNLIDAFSETRKRRSETVKKKTKLRTRISKKKEELN